MKKELANEWLRNDFVNKTILNERELDVLLLYVKGETIVKIADVTGQGTATVSVIIAQLKQKYEIYKQLELTKLQLLK